MGEKAYLVLLLIILPTWARKLTGRALYKRVECTRQHPNDSASVQSLCMSALNVELEPSPLRVATPGRRMSLTGSRSGKVAPCTDSPAGLH